MQAGTRMETQDAEGGVAGYVQSNGTAAAAAARGAPDSRSITAGTGGRDVRLELQW